MAYAAVRDEINTQLLAVAGIGKVYKSKRLVNDWNTFFTRFKDGSGNINVIWFSITEVTEELAEQGAEDEKGQIVRLERVEMWTFELFYGLKDDDTTPSEFTFQTLVEAIQDKFRFLFNLNSTADRSYPLEIISATEGKLGDTLIHRAEFQLKVEHLKIAP